jgi:hypothetical protein
MPRIVAGTDPMTAPEHREGERGRTEDGGQAAAADRGEARCGAKRQAGGEKICRARPTKR